MTTKRSPIPAQFTADNAPSPAALQYMTDLLAKREMPASWRERAEHLLAVGPTKDECSKFIDAVKDLPKRTGTNGQVQAPAASGRIGPRVAYREVQTDKGTRQVGYLEFPDGTTVLAGSYGVDTSGDDRFTNDTSFFRVWIQKEGQDYGKGWNVQLYTSDDTTRVKLNVATQLDQLAAIAKDPLAAAKLYGLEFKRCGVCGRGLTKDESRERGIGPVCASNLGL